VDNSEAFVPSFIIEACLTHPYAFQGELTAKAILLPFTVAMASYISQVFIAMDSLLDLEAFIGHHIITKAFVELKHFATHLFTYSLH